jgi:uncharacterized membrane protein YqjE
VNGQEPAQGLIGQWVHTLAQVAQGVNAGVQLVRGGLEDERDKFIHTIGATVLSMVFVGFGCLLAVLALLLVLPDAWRVGTAVGAALLFWVLAGLGLWRVSHPKNACQPQKTSTPTS